MLDFQKDVFINVIEITLGGAAQVGDAKGYVLDCYKDMKKVKSQNNINIMFEHEKNK